MRINVHDIEESPKELLYEEPTDDLNQLFARGPVHDYTLAGPATISLRHYRAGKELFFAGHAVGRVVGECARCLDDFDFELKVPFSFVLVPRGQGPEDGDPETEDIDLSYYHGHEVDLSPLLREGVLLALPTQPLCREECRGLCPQCGTNLNAASCGCPSAQGDLRFAVLRKLRVGS